MNNKDKLFELLDQHLSGYEPPLPDNDWDNFRNKLRNKGNNNRFWYPLVIYPLIGLLLILNLPLLIQVKEKIFFTQNENLFVTKSDSSEMITKIRKETSTSINQKITKSTTEQTNSTIAGNLNKIQKQTANNSTVYTKQKSELDNTENISKVTEDEIKPSLQQMGDMETVQLTQNGINSLPFKQNDNISKEEEKPLEPKEQPLPSKQALEVPEKNPDSTIAETITKPIKQKKQGVLYFKIVFSVDYTTAKYQVPGSYTNKVHEDYSLIKNDASNGGLGYTVGFNFEYFINPKLSLSSGIFFDENRITDKYNFYNNKIPVFDSITGNIIGYVPGNDTIGIHSSFINNYQYLEIPLIFSYSLWEKKNLIVGVKAGVEGFFFLNADGSTIDKTDLSIIHINSNDYKMFDWGSIAGINIRYKINDRFILGLEPVWKKYWGSVYKADAMVESKPTTYAINASLLIKIK